MEKIYTRKEITFDIKEKYMSKDKIFIYVDFDKNASRKWIVRFEDLATALEECYNQELKPLFKERFRVVLYFKRPNPSFAVSIIKLDFYFDPEEDIDIFKYSLDVLIHKCPVE